VAGVCWLLCLAPAILAATRPVAEPGEAGGSLAESPLKKLGWLVGGTWVAEGEVTGSGDEFDQVVRVSHPDGAVHFLKAHYRREKRDAFRFQAFFRTSETAAWRDALDVVYRRPPAGKG
jgi:predicted NAD/FAD-binding protein